VYKMKIDLSKIRLILNFIKNNPLHARLITSYNPLHARLITSSSYYTSNKLPVVTIYSKVENCSLCDDAKEALNKHNDKFNLNEVDITAKGNKALFDLYKYDIPVIHLNGKEIMRHRVFENVLLDALQLIEEMNTKKQL